MKQLAATAVPGLFKPINLKCIQLKAWLAAAMLGCYICACHAEAKSLEKLQALSHANKLLVFAPVQWNSPAVTAKGFKFTLSRPGARALHTVSIEKADANPIDPVRSQSRSIKGVSYIFGILKTSEGSGGSEYSLRIWKPTSIGGIVVSEEIQVADELHAPDFSTAWKVAELAQIREKARR